MPIERPWARDRQPRRLPDQLTPEWLVELDDVAFARIIRDHLSSSGMDEGSQATRSQLWGLLEGDGALARRAVSVLGEFIDAAETAIAEASDSAPVASFLLATDTLEETEVKQAKKLQRHAHKARARLQSSVERQVTGAD